MISCKKATWLLSKQEENKLSSREQLQLFVHLSICSFCRLFKIQTRWIAHQARISQPSAKLMSPQKKETIKRLLKEEQP